MSSHTIYSSPENLRSPLIPPENKTHLAGNDEQPIERLCIDDMLRKHCGEFGYWQLKHFVLTCLGWALEAFHTMVMIFADRQPDWSCLPNSDCVVAADKGVCELQPDTWQWDGGPATSTVAEWGLICGQKYKVGLVQALFFGGCMIGAGIFGHLSDSKLGRKGSLTVVCILNAFFGLLTSLSPNYLTYTLLRFLTGFSTGGVGLCAFVLATEPVGPSSRGMAGMSTFYFFSGGIALLSGIAYIFQTWRSLYVASSIPSLLFVFLILPFISESPRWYLIRGQTDNAMKIMRAIAVTNGRSLPDNVYVSRDEEVNDNDQKGNEERSREVVTGSVIDALKSPLTRIRLILVVGINFACSVVYYGLSLNVVNLETNLYVNVLVNAIAEMPAFLLTAILIDRFGRKPLGVGTQWFSGAFCIAGSFMDGKGAWKVIRMFCGVLGIFGMAGTYNLLFIYAMELFPTVVRNAALGCATQAAQLGAILAPFVVVMGGGLPFLVFGVCGIVGGFLTFYLPETLNKPLYDTMNGMADGENEV
ncbi:organic cation/carnitine transporter 4 [Cynara cardunculus var. scolymus]|uniref:organic cation/carnitine transporter 4 n=1 Tax=Cynara cardunculus var. scolymus TaxID=59895 RepID=UPI000D624641|nr:organic cation/carnitine transporter 4 [Cynara cardunculus var. scolymus]